MFFRYFIFLTCFITLCSCQQFGLGACPSTTGIKNFDMSKFTGPWRIVEQFSIPLEGTGICNHHIYYMETDKILFAAVYLDVASQTPRIYGINGTFTYNSTIADWNVGLFGITLNMKVLETDYFKYAAVYACQTVFNKVNIAFAWILSRFIDPVTPVTSGRAAFAKFNISVNSLVPTTCPLPI